MNPHGLTGTALVLLLVVAATATAEVGLAETDGVSREAAPDIEVQPEALLFSDGPYESSTRSLTISNVGNASLSIRSIAVVGPDRDSFEVAFEGPVTLAPNESRAIDVTIEAADPRPRFAMLHVLSDDPDEPQRNVWLTNTATVADVSPSRVLAEKTLVNATVQDAEANTTQSLNVSWPLTRDDGVAVDALSFVPERDGNLTLSVATNASRFDGVPAFARSDGTEPAGFVHVDHSIANEYVSDVTFRVRVRRDLLADEETGPEDVALYRYEDGQWSELPTQFVREGNTHFFFEARAPGLSDFAAGLKQAKFRITDAVVTVTRIRTDEGTDVMVRVRNVGGADGTYEVNLFLDENVVDSRELSIAPNGTRQATFERSFDEPGSYRVSVNDRFVGNVTVDSPGTASANGNGDVTDQRSGDDSSPTGRPLPGFEIETTVLVLLFGALFLRVSRRR